MLIEHIEYLRKQPVHVRRKYVLIYSVFLTGVVVAVWISVLVGGRAESGAPLPSDTAESSEETINRADFFESANTFFDAENRPKATQDSMEKEQTEESVSLYQNTASTSSSTESVSEFASPTAPQAAGSTSTVSDQDAAFVEAILEDVAQ